MDAVDRAIMKNYHSTANPNFVDKTWKDFETVAIGKRVFLFGVGNGADLYYYKYGENSVVEAVIDNDKEKLGKYAQEFIFEAMDKKHYELKISNASLLQQYSPEEIVVLIASFRYFEEIAKQLQAMGIKNYFSVLCMEAIYRNVNGIRDSKDRKKEFWDNVGHFQIQENKICIISSVHKFSGHIQEIVKRLLHLHPKLQVVYVAENTNFNIPKGVDIVPWRCIKERIYTMETSKIWIEDDMFDPDVKKKTGQYFLQVKHWSSVTLKSFYFGEFHVRDNYDTFLWYSNATRLIDYILVGSPFDEKTCRQGFNFSGPVIHVGSPRSDILFCSSSIRDVIYSKYSIPAHAYTVLYAPTFRRKDDANGLSTQYLVDLNFSFVKAAIEKRFGGECFILLRLHPLLASSSKNIPRPDYVIDVSDYYDSEELVAASDAMITDYSSIMFEPAFVHKPVFLLATDRERYLKEDRGFLIDYDTLPFPRASSNEELVQNIESFDQEKYVRDVDDFLEKYGVHEDGHAGERAARFILDLIDGKISKPLSNHKAEP